MSGWGYLSLATLMKDTKDTWLNKPNEIEPSSDPNMPEFLLPNQEYKDGKITEKVPLLNKDGSQQLDKSGNPKFTTIEISPEANKEAKKLMDAQNKSKLADTLDKTKSRYASIRDSLKGYKDKAINFKDDMAIKAYNAKMFVDGKISTAMDVYDAVEGTMDFVNEKYSDFERRMRALTSLELDYDKLIMGADTKERILKALGRVCNFDPGEFKPNADSLRNLLDMLRNPNIYTHSDILNALANCEAIADHDLIGPIIGKMNDLAHVGDAQAYNKALRIYGVKPREADFLGLGANIRNHMESKPSDLRLINQYVKRNMDDDFLSRHSSVNVIILDNVTTGISETKPIVTRYDDGTFSVSTLKTNGEIETKKYTVDSFKKEHGKVPVFTDEIREGIIAIDFKRMKAIQDPEMIQEYMRKEKERSDAGLPNNYLNSQVFKKQQDIIEKTVLEKEPLPYEKIPTDKDDEFYRAAASNTEITVLPKKQLELNRNTSSPIGITSLSNKNTGGTVLKHVDDNMVLLSSVSDRYKQETYVEAPPRYLTSFIPSNETKTDVKPNHSFVRDPIDRNSYRLVITDDNKGTITSLGSYTKTGIRKDIGSAMFDNTPEHIKADIFVTAVNTGTCYPGEAPKETIIKGLENNRHKYNVALKLDTNEVQTNI